MAASLVANSLVIAADIKFSLTQEQLDGSVQNDAFSVNRYSQLPSDANLYFHKGYSLSGSGSQTLDLDNLTDVFGNTIAFAKIYAFLVQNLATTGGWFITVGGGDFTTIFSDASDIMKVGPKGCLFLSSPVDGYTVTASSGDGLLITNGTANGVSIKVTIVGKS